MYVLRYYVSQRLIRRHRRSSRDPDRAPRRATEKARTVSTKLPRRAVLSCSAAALLAVTFGAPAAAEPGDGTWDPSLPKIVSAGAPGDPLAIANASLRATAIATQATMDFG